MASADTGTPDSNEALMVRVAGGDRVAFRLLYASTAPRLHAIALRMSRRGDLAQDAVQECYLRIWRKAGSFDPARGLALPWMATILRHVVLDRLPAERPYEDVAEVEIAVPPAEPGEVRLHSCLKRLAEMQLKAVLLVYYDGLTHVEVSERLAVPLGTAKSWVRRGIESLKTCLEGPRGANV